MIAVLGCTTPWCLGDIEEADMLYSEGEPEAGGVGASCGDADESGVRSIVGADRWWRCVTAVGTHGGVEEQRRVRTLVDGCLIGANR